MLVTQSFGNENEYRRVILAIWSYWVYRPNDRVLLFTDMPVFFHNYFSDMPIDYMRLTPDKIRKMRGEIDFLHRMKIALIEEALQLSEANLMYVDSDVFFVANPIPLMQGISENESYMHRLEYRFDSLADMKMPAAQPFHAFLTLIQEKGFLGEQGRTIAVTPLHYSWNAGAMILHNSVKNLLPDVYALTDQFYPPTQNHASEQYAFSIVLQNTTNVRPCDSIVFHYWYRVKKQIMDAFLLERIDDNWAQLSVSDKVEMVVKWTKMLPSYMDNHVLALRDGAIQAFNESQFLDGYTFAFRAILKGALNKKFMKDILYHTRRVFGGKQH